MKKLFISISHAWRGITWLLKVEVNARFELMIAIFVIGLGIWFKLSGPEWCFVLICIGSVLAAEAFNTSVENLCDFHTKEVDERIKIIKDVASGSVLITGIMAFLVGCVIFLPKIFQLFGGS